MRVLIVGSARDRSEAGLAAFAAACRDVGVALARAGHDLVVGSDGEGTADKAAVGGFLSVEGRRTIRLCRPEDDPTPYVAERQQPGLQVAFVDDPLKGPWVTARVSQILQADAVVILGGGELSVQAGSIAPALGRPVLPVPVFAGAGEALWKQLAPLYGQAPETLRQGFQDLRLPWEPARAEALVKAIPGARRLFRRPSDWKGLVALLLTVLVPICVWVWLFASPPPSRLLAYFALTGLAAVTGSALHEALRSLAEPEGRSWEPVVIRVITGLGVAFGMAVIYLIGAFTVTGKFDFISSTAQPEDFQRVGLSMTVLGLASGWLTEKVADVLQRWIMERL